jgi:hypothetical protein
MLFGGGQTSASLGEQNLIGVRVERDGEAAAHAWARPTPVISFRWQVNPSKLPIVTMARFARQAWSQELAVGGARPIG